MSSLRELGLLSARYAEEEALKQRSLLSSIASVAISSLVEESSKPSTTTTTSTIVSAPVPIQKVGSSSSSSSPPSTLPGSPVFVQTPPTPNITADNSSNVIPANLLPFLAAQQNTSFPGGIGFFPMANPFGSITTQQGLLMTTNFPAVQTVGSSLPSTTLLTTATQLPPPPTSYSTPAPAVEVFSSLSAARVRKPFHKRRPAHMDKNMLFCHFCGRKETPEWRKGPSGPATLCNACGLQWAKKIRAQRSSSSSSSSSSSPTITPSTTPKPTKSTSKVASSSKTNESATSDVQVSKVEN